MAHPIKVVHTCVALAFLSAPTLSIAKTVRVGDAIIDNEANHFVIYYKSIPGVGNPGMRAHEYFSYREVADALRRAKNNGYVIDFIRSYMEFGYSDIILAGNEPPPPKRKAIKMNLVGTTWKGTITNPKGGPFVMTIKFNDDGYIQYNKSKGGMDKWSGSWNDPNNGRIKYETIYYYSGNDKVPYNLTEDKSGYWLINYSDMSIQPYPEEDRGKLHRTK